MFLAPVAIPFARGFELTAVFCDERLHGPRGGFAERANRLAVDVVGNIPEQIHVFGTTMALPDAVEHLFHPQRAFTAGRALAARLVRVKLRHIERALHDVDRIIEHNNATRTGHRAGFAQRLEIKRHVNLISLQHGHRTASGDDTLQLAPRFQAAAYIINELAHRQFAHLELVIARPFHRAADTHEPRPARAGDAEFLEPRRARSEERRV